MSREGPDGRKKGHLAEKDPSDDGRGFAKKLKEKWEMADNSIDIERLRRDMADECMAASFGGGIGPALLDSLDIEEASDEKLLAIARQYGYDLNRYKR